MVNGYGLFLIAWFFVGFVVGCYKASQEEYHVASIIGCSAKFVGMVWLVFQI